MDEDFRRLVDEAVYETPVCWDVEAGTQTGPHRPMTQSLEAILFKIS